MIENVFELDDLRVSEIATPRTKITWLDVNDPLYKHLEVIAEKQYSCYVVAEEDLEHVLGVVYTKRFLADVLVLPALRCAVCSSRCMCLKVCIPKSCWICSRTRGSRWRWSWTNSAGWQVW
ncbi:MAG: hypothetical protein ACLR2G_06650 [Phascolarctobacterium faecium]